MCVIAAITAATAAVATAVTRYIIKYKKEKGKREETEGIETVESGMSSEGMKTKADSSQLTVLEEAENQKICTQTKTIDSMKIYRLNEEKEEITVQSG